VIPIDAVAQPECKGAKHEHWQCWKHMLLYA
jgi:hypothetical protein